MTRYGKEDRKIAEKLNDVWVWRAGQGLSRPSTEVFSGEMASCLRSVLKYSVVGGVGKQKGIGLEEMRLPNYW